MTVLSKFFASTLGMKLLTANCYEAAHPWEHDCNKVVIDATPGGFWFCLKTYTTFYVRGDVTQINWKNLAVSILQSSAFLTANMIFVSVYFCRVRFRQLLGFFTWPTLSYVPTILSSLTAILIERPSRRPPLALYLTNQASETAFRQLVNHGYLRKIPHGEILPFIFGLAGFFYLYQQGRLNKSYSAIYGISKKNDLINLNKFPERLKAFFLEMRTRYSKSPQCEHHHSCVSNAFEASLTNFSIGLGASGTLTILRNLKAIFTKPTHVLRQLTSFNNFRIPLFFAGLPLLYHATSCLLNRRGPEGKKYAPLVAGTVSGLSIAAFPNVTISMYTMWKAIETIYFDLADQGKLPYVPYGDVLLYSLSTGYVLGNVVLEPQSVPKTYIKFLNGLTGNRINQFNHPLIDIYGFDTNRTFQHKIPQFSDTKHCTINPALYLPNR